MLEPSQAEASQLESILLPRGARLAALAGWSPSAQRFMLTCVCGALLVALVYWPTLTLSPPLWMDEAHIVEYGRLFLEPNTTWSLHWHGDHPVMPWYVVGATVQELLHRVTTPSCLSARIIGVSGGLFAMTMLAAWLRQRRVQPIAALIIPFTYLFEPLFIAAYRGGRLDGWTQGCAFSACYLLSTWRERGGDGRLIAAGALVATGFFTWPSITMLTPLMLLELWPAMQHQGKPRWGVALRFFGAAALMLACIASIVVWRVPRVLHDITAQLNIAGMTPKSVGDPFATRVRILLEILFPKAPWHLVLLPFALYYARSYRPILLMLIPLTIIMSSLLYANRVMYLLPYLHVFYSELFREGVRVNAPRLRGQPLALWLVAGTLTAAATLSLGLRSINAWRQREVRDERQVFEAARKLPTLTAPICLEAHEFYFSGRALGWQMFSSKIEDIPHCDTAIVQPAADDATFKQQLLQAGFQRELRLLDDQSVETTPYGYGARGFGPFDFYRRTAR